MVWKKQTSSFFAKKIQGKIVEQTCLEQNWLTSRKIHIEGEWFNIASYLYKYIRICRLLDNKNVNLPRPTLSFYNTSNFNFLVNIFLDII